MPEHIKTADGGVVLLTAVVRQAWRDARRGRVDAVAFLRMLQAEYLTAGTVPRYDEIFRRGTAPRRRRA